MNGFFRIDGPFYKFGTILYYLVVSNILWAIFSIPVFTVGASTTALFYVMGKIVRDDDIQVVKNFWSSFKLNFKQSTVIWLILLIISFIVHININNISMFGTISRLILSIQLFIAFEIILTTIYIFPLISRFDMKIPSLFKTALILGNKHLLTTLLCISCLCINTVLLYFVPGLLVLFFISLNALCISFLMHRIFKKYTINDDIKTSCENCNAEIDNSL